MEPVEAYLDRVRQAWDAGDPDAFVREFAQDATYVIFAGDVLLGRDAIRNTHSEAFASWLRNSRMRIKLLHTHSLGEAGVCILTIGGIGKDPHVPYDKFQTSTLVRDGQGAWQCVAFQNTDMSNRARNLYNQIG